MTPELQDIAFAIELLRRLFAPMPSQRPCRWIAEHVVFNEPEVKGPFDLTGRKYLEQPLDDNNDSSVSEQTLVFGTGLGKTITYMAGVAWKIVHRPQRGLWVMPATNGANGVRNFNNSRLRPMLEATAATAKHIPTGANRHQVSGLHVRLNGMVIDFAGANSPGQLTGNRCGDVRLDEVDKFKAKLGQEAGANYIARTRTDGVIGSQIFQSSSPTIDTGLIWTALLNSNLNRRFIPCPKCGRQHPSSKNFVIAWSEQFTVMPGKFPDGGFIPTAFVVWDKEAMRKDGSWDMDRVVRSARVQCPHCGGDVIDSDMQWCDENGIWKPTQRDVTANRHAGYHLPSMYAPRRGFESTFGGMAKKFLECKLSSDGMRGFINSVLAEPDVTQEHAYNKIEIQGQKRISDDNWWTALLTSDVQQKWPYFFFSVRKWRLFTLTAPLELKDGKLSQEQTNGAAGLCKKLASDEIAAEILRFPSPASDYPLIEWLVAQKITGIKLEKFYRVTCKADTLELGRRIHGELKTRMPRGGDSEAVAAGHCDTWDELKGIQDRFNIGKGLPFSNAGVMIDSGFGAYENAEVMRNCFAMATEFAWRNPVTKEFTEFQIQGFQPFARDGWLPCKGFPSRKRWTDTGISLPWRLHVDDPFKGTSEAGIYLHYLFEYAAELFMDKLDDLRNKRGGYLWTVANDIELFPFDDNGVSEFKIEEYWRHLNGMYKDREENKWKDRSKQWPTHLHDAERMQIALASYLGIFSYDGAKSDRAMTEQPKENQK